MAFRRPPPRWQRTPLCRARHKAMAEVVVTLRRLSSWTGRKIALRT